MGFSTNMVKKPKKAVSNKVMKVSMSNIGGQDGLLDNSESDSEVLTHRDSVGDEIVGPQLQEFEQKVEAVSEIVQTKKTSEGPNCRQSYIRTQRSLSRRTIVERRSSSESPADCAIALAETAETKRRKRATRDKPIQTARRSSARVRHRWKEEAMSDQQALEEAIARSLMTGHQNVTDQNDADVDLIDSITSMDEEGVVSTMDEHESEYSEDDLIAAPPPTQTNGSKVCAKAKGKDQPKLNRYPNTRSRSKSLSPEKETDPNPPLHVNLQCPHKCERAMFTSSAKLLGHLRTTHRYEPVSTEMEASLSIRYCSNCGKYYFRTTFTKHKCTHDITAEGKAVKYPTPDPRHFFLCAPGTKKDSWVFVPLILHALGLIEHGGRTQTMAGSRWTQWVDGYKADFASREIKPKDLQIDLDGYMTYETQNRLLRKPFDSGTVQGESKVTDELEMSLLVWTEEAAKLWTTQPHISHLSTNRQPSNDPFPQDQSYPYRNEERVAELQAGRGGRSRCNARGRRRGRGRGWGRGRGGHADPRLIEPDAEQPLDEIIVRRPTSQQVAEHRITWSFIPKESMMVYVATMKPKFNKLLMAHTQNRQAERARALDEILLAVGTCLIRKRGGVNAKHRLTSMMEAHRRDDDQGNEHPPRNLTLPKVRNERTEEECWQAKLKYVANITTRPNWRIKQVTTALLSKGLLEPTQQVLDLMHDKQFPSSGQVPNRPDSAPLIVVDPETLAHMLKKGCNNRSGGASGWTAELLYELWSDETCRKAIIVIVELIANDLWDDHSRDLLTTSIQLGTAKDLNDLRPIKLGEEFLHLAQTYCLSLVQKAIKPRFGGIQLCMEPGGTERAHQAVQAHLGAVPTDIAAHLDLESAYQRLKRPELMQKIYAEDDLKYIHRIINFTYGRPSTILVRDRGHVIDSFQGEEGVNQGCVLAALAYAFLFHPAYVAAVEGAEGLTAKAIVDDFTVVGPPDIVFPVVDRYFNEIKPLGGKANNHKSKIQCGAEVDPESIKERVTERKMTLIRGNTKYLGGQVGHDIEAMKTYVTERLNPSVIEKAISDPITPISLAITLAKTCILPQPTYLLRAMPLEATLEPILKFDLRVRQALCKRIGLPFPLPETANISLTQPNRNGGVGLRSMHLVAPAAKWAAAAVVAPDLEHIVESAAQPELLPFVIDRKKAYDLLVSNGVEVADTRPPPQQRDPKNRL